MRAIFIDEISRFAGRLVQQIAAAASLISREHTETSGLNGRLCYCLLRDTELLFIPLINAYDL